MRLMIWVLTVVLSTATLAQEVPIEVNQGEWNQLTEEDRQSIESLVKESFPGMEVAIAPLPGAMAAASAAKKPNPFCTAFCDFSAALVGIGCPAIGGSGGPLLISLCGVIATQAKAACYKKCGVTP
jgi:hypothetical protein